jgi:HTH-type transcriptional regulator/antitoxin HigA
MAIRPDDYPTPGQYLRALLAERGWDQKTLAHVLGLDYRAVLSMGRDEKPLSAFVALMLADVFEVSADGFLELQQKYDLAVARASTRPDRKRALRAALFGSLPVSEMIKRGWLDVRDFKDIEKVESEVARFFGVESVEKIPSLAAI